MPLRIVQNEKQRWSPQRGAYILGGKYQLETPIAEGGMGSVWRAHQVALQRPVGVKFVKVDEPHMVERFLRETRVAASIRNPHVIDMIDFGTTPTGQPVLVMELLEGESLEDILSRRMLGVCEVVSVMTQLLVALEAVHAEGIIHGDLKPANVFLSNDGTDEPFVRLIDFGIAYSLDPESNLRRGRNGTDLRTISGTPEYMAPELAECLPTVDARADVYGAGVMLYELLTGVLPFEAEHAGGVLFKVMDGKYTPLITLRPDLPELAAIVTSAMARDRADRPQTANALRMLLLDAIPMVSGAFQLTAMAPSEQEKAKISERQLASTLFGAPPSPSRSKWSAWALASLLLGALALLGFAVSQSTSAPDVTATPAADGVIETAALVNIPPLAPPAPAGILRIETPVEPAVLAPAAVIPHDSDREDERVRRVPVALPASAPVRAHGLRRSLDF